jgi:hypothetical protein
MITATSLSKHYGPVTAVDGVNCYRCQVRAEHFGLHGSGGQCPGRGGGEIRGYDHQLGKTEPPLLLDDVPGVRGVNPVGPGLGRDDPAGPRPHSVDLRAGRRRTPVPQATFVHTGPPVSCVR